MPTLRNHNTRNRIPGTNCTETAVSCLQVDFGVRDWATITGLELPYTAKSNIRNRIPGATLASG
eukprot:1764393-Rhodomonas_salina.1